MHAKTGGVDRMANSLAAARPSRTARPAELRRHRCRVGRLALGLLTLSSSLAAHDALRLWYTGPATKWEEAIPLGNGHFGAMVFGGTTNEHFQLNEDTLYSGYPGHRDVRLNLTNDFATMTNLIVRREFAEAECLATAKWLGAAQACYQPLGDVFLDFDQHGQPTHYVRELDLATAVCRVRYQVDGVNFTREAFASHPDDALVVRLTSDKPGRLGFRVRFTSPHPTATTWARANDAQLTMRGQVPGFVLRRELATVESRKDTWKYPWLWDEQGQRRPGAQQVVYDGRGMFFEVRLRIQTVGGTVTADDAGLLAVAGADEAAVLLTVASSFNGFDKDPVDEGAGWVYRGPCLAGRPVADRHPAQSPRRDREGAPRAKSHVTDCATGRKPDHHESLKSR